MTVNKGVSYCEGPKVAAALCHSRRQRVTISQASALPTNAPLHAQLGSLGRSVARWVSLPLAAPTAASLAVPRMPVRRRMGCPGDLQGP